MAALSDTMEAAADGVLLRLKVVPGAKRSAVVGLLGDRLKVAVSAPPERGKANDAVVALLAEALGVAVRDIEVTAGHTQPRKTVRVAGVDVDHVAQRLGEAT